MTVTIETLEKLERKMTLTLAADSIQNEVNERLKRLSRQVKIDGFRPGKVPMNIVAQRYGYSVHYEVMNDKVGEAFAQAANEANLRVAGQPRISEKDEAPEGQLAFDAIFEVYPEIKLPDLSSLEVERAITAVSPEAIDKTTLMKAATIWAAEQLLNEKNIGSLETGKLGDYIIIDKDYFALPVDQIHTIKPVITVVGGKVVYQSSAL